MFLFQKHGQKEFVLQRIFAVSCIAILTVTFQKNFFMLKKLRKLSHGGWDRRIEKQMLSG